MTRLALGFLTAPLLPAVIALALKPFAADIPANSGAGMVLFLSLFSPVFAAPATVVFAIPLYLWFRRRNWLRLHHALLGGAVVGLATTATFAAYGFLTSPNLYRWSDGKLFVHWSYLTEPLNYAMLFVPYGVVMGAAFWVIAYWKRTPNSTPHPDARTSAVPNQPPSARAGERGR
jgi:hypothetical protein